MHALIFWGFLILLTTILEVGVRSSTRRSSSRSSADGLAGFLQDLLALGVLVGIAIALTIRLGQRPERFVGSHATDAYRILGLIFWIIATLFLARGAGSPWGTRPRRGGRRSRPRWRAGLGWMSEGGSGARCGRRSGSTS